MSSLSKKFTPTPESPAMYGGGEWLSGSEFRPPKERRNYTKKKPRDLSRGVFTICIIGRSGSGKGVQAHMILRARGKRIHHMETGRFLRDIVYRHTNPTTAIARRLMGQGKLFPAWFSSYTWLREIIEGGRADKEFLFDGAPRQIFEARLLDEVLGWHGRPKSLCIYLDVNEKTVASRLFSRGRADDTAQAIKNRMEYFRRDVLPVIAYYRRAGRIISVNGEEAPDIVFQNISKNLARRLGKQWSVKR